MSRHNNFTFLRLMLSMMVLFGHTYVIGGFGPDPIVRLSLGQTSFQELGVKGFFVLSGFLLMGSQVTNPDLRRFALRRCFRILPGFWVTILISALVVAPLLVFLISGSEFNYWNVLHSGGNDALGYLGRNLGLYIAQPEILSAAAHTSRPVVANGSLWSLFYEAICYLFLAVVFKAGLARRRVVLGIFGLVYAVNVVDFLRPLPFPSNTSVMGLIYNLGAAPSGPCVFLAFLSGMAMYHLVRGELPSNRWLLLTAGVSLLLSMLFGGFNVVWPLAFPYLIIGLGRSLPFAGLDNFGDISYGVYLYSALIQNALVLLGMQHAGFLIYLAWTVVFGVISGLGSWFFVERPAIQCGAGLIVRLGEKGRGSNGA